MKKLKMFILIFLVLYNSCNFSGPQSNGTKVSFSIYEVVNINEMPKHIMDNMMTMNIQVENNTERSIIGYIHQTDTSFLQLTIPGGIKLIKTQYKVDRDGEYYAIVATKPNPVIDNSDIKNTKSYDNKVEIIFNIKGANKWADLTKNNIGKTLAFVIDNQVYSMPVIKAEIRNGVAILDGLENETISKNISKSLNLSRSE